MTSFTICPNEIIKNPDIDGNERSIWLFIAMYDNLKHWKHNVRNIANNLGLCINTVLKKIRSLVEKGLLGRKEKEGIEFGYVYYIPDKFKKFDGVNDSKTEGVVPKNFYENSSNFGIAKNGIAKNGIAKNGVYINNEKNNTELNKTDSINQEKDERNVLYLEDGCVSEVLESTDILETTISNYKNTYTDNKNLDEDTNSVAVVRQEEQKGSNEICEEVVFADEKFLSFVQRELPNMRNLRAYLCSRDKETGEPIWAKYWAKFKGCDKTASVERYWKERLPYDVMDWENELPSYTQWLNRVKNCKREDSFTEDESLGQHRNTRIMFYRWYENYYLPMQDMAKAKEENQGGLQPVNTTAKEMISQFLKAWGK